MKANGQMAARTEPNVKDVPNTKQVRNQGHGEYEDTLDRNGNPINKTRHAENGHRDQQKHGGYHDPCHVRPQIRMGLHSILLVTGGRARSKSLAAKRKTK